MNRITGTFKPKNPNGIFLLGEFGEINDWKVAGYHFSGGSGQELKRMCRETGFNFYECYHDMVFSIPGLTHFDPKYFVADWTRKNPYIKPEFQDHVDHIRKALYDSNCHIVVALGDLALFVLTGEKSVAKWRGSRMSINLNGRDIKVIPTYAPSRILKVWDWRHIAMYDLTRVLNESLTQTYFTPEVNYITGMNFGTAEGVLDGILIRLEMSEKLLISHDVETIARNISVSGLAWSRTDAICIPFMTTQEGAGGNHNYWTVEQEATLVHLINRILTHPNAMVVGQNYLYDMQHEAKSHGIKPNVYMDTMLAWHTVFPGERKSLDFLASLFCDYYCYWKDELKDYNSYPADEQQYWDYNCKDCCYTFEIAEKVIELIVEANQTDQYEFQMSMYDPVFQAMLRGVRIDMKVRKEMSGQLLEVAFQLEAIIMAMTGNYRRPEYTGQSLWFNSSQEVMKFFYDYLGLPKQWNRKTRALSGDEDALKKLAEIEPVVEPIIRHILELRSVNIFRKNFLDAPLGNDQRIRCSYNLAGTETFRLSSSKDAFGQGANLQTIPSGNEDD